MLRTVLCAIALTITAGTTSHAAAGRPAEETQQELKLLRLLEANPELSKAIYAKLRAKYEPAAAGRSPYPTPSSTDIFERGIRENNVAHGDPAVAPAPSKTAADDGPQRLFIRKDSIDTFLYGIQSRDKAQGASISYTNNEVSKAQTAQIDGFMAYIAAGAVVNPDAGKDYERATFHSYAIAPWISAHGNLNTANTKSERSALKTGIDTQFEFAGGLFDTQAFTLTPYYQSDFRGIARIEGFNAHWDPVLLSAHLGGSRSHSDILDWFWQTRLETDIRKVENAGLTNLATGNYAWVGTTNRLNLFFFPSDRYVPWFLADRLSLTVTGQAYTDANSHRSIYRITPEIAYKLSDDGSTSVSLQYDRGTDRDTLTTVNQYVAKLNYKY